MKEEKGETLEESHEGHGIVSNAFLNLEEYCEVSTNKECDQ
jgi:hypothetical protein